MDSSTRGDMTPRRSTRLQQKQREQTPEAANSSAYKPRGPRAMAKLNKSKLNKSVPAIIITSPDKNKKEKDPVQTQNKAVEKPIEEKKVEPKESTKDQAAMPDATVNEQSGTLEKEKSEEQDNNIQESASKAEKDEVIKETEEGTKEEKIRESPSEKHETYAEVVIHGASVNENDIEENREEKPTNDKATVSEVKQTVTEPIKDENLLDTTPQLMDESIISVSESVDETVPPKDATFSPDPRTQAAKDTTFSPEPKNTSQPVKDSTFSPIADKSIQDSRPHIEIETETEFNTTPLPRNNITHRTSTPLAHKIMKRDTPKAGTSAMAALARVFSPKLPANVVEALNDTVNGQFKLINPLERSILKSTRKRSLSVTDGESFVQKKVMFISPKVMDIGEIDERMMQSFREEKEISMKAIAASGTRRKRSLSASETPIAKSKKHMPDFKAIHEAQFKKMESIEEHKARKAERAKRLITPSKSLPVASGQGTSQQQQPAVKVAAASKIPKSSRQPLTIKPQTDNVKVALKRSASAEPQTSQIKKPSFVPTLPRAMSQQETVKPKIRFPPIKSKSQTSVLQERREKNMSLYKTNVTRTGTADIRKKNETIIKGVRLNRRFELMMQNRMAQEASEHADD